MIPCAGCERQTRRPKMQQKTVQLRKMLVSKFLNVFSAVETSLKPRILGAVRPHNKRGQHTSSCNGCVFAVILKTPRVGSFRSHANHPDSDQAIQARN